MATHVVKAAQLSIESADQDQRFADYFGGEEISRVRDLAGVTDDLPCAREDLLLLYLKYLGRRVKTRGESPCTLDIGINLKIGIEVVHEGRRNAPSLYRLPDAHKTLVMGPISELYRGRKWNS